MKKTYIAPLTEVVKINVEKMLSGSDKVATGSNYNGTGVIQSKDDVDYDEDLW